MATASVNRDIVNLQAFAFSWDFPNFNPVYAMSLCRREVAWFMCFNKSRYSDT